MVQMKFDRGGLRRCPENVSLESGKRTQICSHYPPPRPPMSLPPNMMGAERGKVEREKKNCPNSYRAQTFRDLMAEGQTRFLQDSGSWVISYRSVMMSCSCPQSPPSDSCCLHNLVAMPGLAGWALSVHTAYLCWGEGGRCKA